MSKEGVAAVAAKWRQLSGIIVKCQLISGESEESENNEKRK
jgi:hypothetical protein